MESVDKVYGEKSADFALGLFRQSAAAGGDSPANVLLSPASVLTALALTYEGADGATRRRMNETVFGGLDDGTVERNVDALTRLLDAPADPAKGYRLASANRMFVERTCPLAPGFVKLLHDRFRAEATGVDFKTQANQVVKQINDWAAEKTGGKITKLFDRLSADDRLVLANAVYFKGDWSTKFDPALTTAKPFYPAELVATKTLDTMCARVKKGFGFNGRDDHCSLLSVPYKGDELAMVVLLPKERFGLAALERGLTGKRLWALIDQARNVEVVVELPKFKFESSVDVKECLMKMGLVDMFSEKADFSKMSDSSLHISAVQHKAFLEINEEGSEAAALTAVVATARCMPSPPEEFKADHPFMFAIVEKKSRVLLFLGHFCG